MSIEKKPDFKLSYESDGEMGKKQKGVKQKQDGDRKKDTEMFFNTTQDSE